MNGGFVAALAAVVLMSLFVGAYLPFATEAAKDGACPTSVRSSITLKSDCVGSIAIVKSHVTFNGAGHTVNGSGSGNGITLGPGIHDVMVKNTVVTGFDYGFFLDGAYSNRLTGNNASLNRYAGFQLQWSSSNVLTNNRADGNGRDAFFGGAGFSVLFGSSNLITDDVAKSNVGVGFNVSGSSNTFSNDTASGNSYDGFQVFGSSSLTAMMFNGAMDNGNYGFEDASIGSGTSGTASTYVGNSCIGNAAGGSRPPGLC